VAVVGLTCASCGDKKSPPKIDPEARRAALEKVAAECDAAVPAALKGKLAFEAVLDKDKSVAYVRPKGWKEVFDGNQKADDLGFSTGYWVSGNCDGTCSPKDWEAVAAKVDFAQFVAQDGKFKVDEDEKGDGQRVLVAHADQTYVVVAKWKKGESRYFACRATLDKEIADAAPVFEKACRALDPLY
jgi:hypothetical protein